MILASLLLLAVAFLLFLLSQPAKPPPAISLAGLDPAIASVIRQAQGGVGNSPKSAEAWGHLGKALLVYDFRAEAADCFAEAARLNPREARWWYFHGLALLPEQDGMASLRRAVDLFGDAGDVPRLRLAQVLAERGQMNEAEIEFKRLLERHPDNAPAALGLARILLAQGRTEESLRQLQVCFSSPLTARGAQMLAASIYQRMGLVDKAEDAGRLAATLPLDPPFRDPFIEEASQLRTGSKAWLDHAQQLIRHGQFAEAEPILRRTVREYPDFADAWIALGGILLRHKQHAQAEEALRQAVTLSAQSVEARTQLGVAVMYQGRLEEAASHFLRTIEMQPSLAEAHFNLGLCQGQLNHRAEAMEAFRNAIRFKPDLVEAYLGLAQLLMIEGKPDEARIQLVQARQLKPSDERIGRLMDQLTAGNR